MPENDLTLSRRMDEIIGRTDDPRDALVELVQEFGARDTTQVARIVFGSWRSRVDLVEETLRQVLAEQGGADL